MPPRLDPSLTARRDIRCQCQRRAFCNFRVSRQKPGSRIEQRVSVHQPDGDSVTVVDNVPESKLAAQLCPQRPLEPGIRSRSTRLHASVPVNLDGRFVSHKEIDAKSRAIVSSVEGFDAHLASSS